MFSFSFFLYALAPEFNCGCFLRSRCSMEMWFGHNNKETQTCSSLVVVVVVEVVVVGF